MTTTLFSRFASASRKRFIILTIAAVILLALAATACTKPASVAVDPSDPCRPTITAAAGALDKRDNAAFLATLSSPLRSGLTQYLDLTGTGPAKLAKVLRDAKLIAEYDQVRVYESKLDGETVTFMAVKEGQQWLLTGL